MNFQYVANYTAEVSDRILIALYSLLFKKLISKSIINSQIKKYPCQYLS